MKNKYYHGLAGDVPFFEEQEVLDESLITLKSIFTVGGIYCRNSLDKYVIPVMTFKEAEYLDEKQNVLCKKL